MLWFLNFQRKIGGRLESEIQRKINMHLICTLNPLAWRLTFLGRVLNTLLCLVQRRKWIKLASFEKVSSFRNWLLPIFEPSIVKNKTSLGYIVLALLLMGRPSH